MVETLKHILGTCGENHINILHFILFVIAYAATIITTKNKQIK